MLFLLLSLLCSVMLGFLFKVYLRYGIDIFQSIVFNYITCFCCGWIHLGHFPVTQESTGSAWMPYALILGLIFISGFNVAALTVRHYGVTVSQVMQKMSILMSAPFAVLVYGESSGWVKIAGFALALAAIILVNWPSRQQTADSQAGKNTRSAYWWIPLVTWILSGCMEVLFVRVRYEGFADLNDPTFIICVFGTAGVVGLLVALRGWFTRRLVFNWKYVGCGILLGVPNYGSMLFMLWALAGGLEGSFVFPVTNVGIIVLTTVGAVAIFHERLSRINWLGIGLAIAGIALISI